jgi:hypothetical protein
VAGLEFDPRLETAEREEKTSDDKTSYEGQRTTAARNRTRAKWLRRHSYTDAIGAEDVTMM